MIEKLIFKKKMLNNEINSLGAFDLQNGKYWTEQNKTEPNCTGKKKRDNIFAILK
jgi:hypothetical protein